MTRLIPLSGRTYPGIFAIVDDDDFDLVSAFRWSPDRIVRRDGSVRWYARRGIKRNGRVITQRMHQLILGTTKGEVGDHVDGNGLNNTRQNLRRATLSQNQVNRQLVIRPACPYRGVVRSGGRWRAQIRVSGRRHVLGTFSTMEEAAHAYDEVAREHFGRFARPNFPEDAYCTT